MEFRHKETDNASTPVEALRINWVYRPRDVSRFSNDSRLVYATMHSDVCPLTSLRGKCKVLHRSEIDNMDEYRKEPDAFFFTQCFDRFIHRWYEVIPVSQVINVPEKVKKALDERWKYVVVEATRVKELTSDVKTCKRCGGYCATYGASHRSSPIKLTNENSNDSVECAVCHDTYHMNCVRPPLLKKPSRGFAWACAPCSRAQERKLEARRTPIVGDIQTDADEDEVLEEEEDETGAGVKTSAPSPNGIEAEDRPATQAEIAHAKMWPMRYLGIHCRVEDALQYDDRAIYPRASSRLGPKHQANVLPWYGRPVELVKPVEIKKKFVKNTTNKKDAKLTKETQAAIDEAKAKRAQRPKWQQDEPPGYVHRGEDLSNKDRQNTAKLLFTMPPQGVHSSRGLDDNAVPPEQLVDDYMKRAKQVAIDIGVDHWSTDFLDLALYHFNKASFDIEAALKELRGTKKIGSYPANRLDIRKDLRDPKHTLTTVERKRFREAVAKYGSELRSVRLHVETAPHADIVRYWYFWKKTTEGKEIWGSFGGRKNTKKKAEMDAASKLLDDIADDHDDSAFDNDKIGIRQRKMICKFCNTRKSRFWRRAPGVKPGQTVPADGRSKEKHSQLYLALCQRCARLWRKYAIQWEDQDEIAKKVSQAGGRAWKRRVDEELVREWNLAAQESSIADTIEAADMTPTVQSIGEPARKKVKTGPDGTSTPSGAEPSVKKRAPAPAPPPPPREPTPPIVPNDPKMKNFPCAVCECFELHSDPLISCRDCKLTVHPSCYGLSDLYPGKWSCDMCQNDRREAAGVVSSTTDPASYKYKCVLCPVEITPVDMVEPPKVSHKKKTEREREKERLEKELAVSLAETYRKNQQEKGKPPIPREPLKRTANNNWVHVTCALFTPEVKFSNAKSLELAEGIPWIPKVRWEQVCKLCKTSEGACVSCHQCHVNFHVGCAHREQYVFGFDVQPVKSSRRDGVSIVTLGAEDGRRETGTVSAAIWCKEHESSIKTIVHPMQEEVADGSFPTALQLFVQTYKQADLTLTGTMRKANLLDEFNKTTAAVPVATGGNRRVSTATVRSGGRNSSAGLAQHHETREVDGICNTPQKDKLEMQCYICGSKASPRWRKLDSSVAASFASIRRQTPTEDGLITNGVKHESSIDHENPALADGLQFGNAGPETSPTIAKENGVPITTLVTESTTDAYECNKCHWMRINSPDELRKSMQETEEVDDEPLESTLQRHPAPTLPWAPPVSTTLHRPVQMPDWPHSFGNGSLHSPQGPNNIPPHPMSAALPMHPHPHAQVPLAGPYQVVPPAIGVVPMPFVYQGHGVSNLHLQHSTLASGLPNGLPSPHVALGSPTHPPPLNGPPRPADSPRAAPQHVGGYVPHQGSPVPPIGPPRPTTPRDVSAPLSAGGRPAHGASASPNVRNLIDG